MAYIRFSGIWFGSIVRVLQSLLTLRVYVGRSPAATPAGSIIFFPMEPNRLSCGLAGLVTINAGRKKASMVSMPELGGLVDLVAGAGHQACASAGASWREDYLGGPEKMALLMEKVRKLKRKEPFAALFQDQGLETELKRLKERLTGLVKQEESALASEMGLLDTEAVAVIAARIEELKDIAWCIGTEILGNIDKIRALANPALPPPGNHALSLLKEINTVLNSIDRLEVRGRDSAGLSLIFYLARPEFEALMNLFRSPENPSLLKEFQERNTREILVNRSITVHELKNGAQVAVAMVYKVAAEIGSLGDNIRFLRSELHRDLVLQHLIACPLESHSILTHTRWASVGAITEPNCHPVDNDTPASHQSRQGVIHVCLNGDIDNYLELKARYENSGDLIHKDITTDTKIIPLQIDTYLRKGADVSEAFRLALNDFEGSHAICMHTDLAPGKLFLGQRGSGQAMFVGISAEHYMPTSEVYGFVEETDTYIKLDGEKIVTGPDGKQTQGQILILDQNTGGGLDGLTGLYYDGTPIDTGALEPKRTPITSRDIDRQDFAHYFLKEITEAPASVERTLQNRWKINERDGSRRYRINLDETVVPATLKEALQEGRIRRVFFVGQGTAGVAAAACADILSHYLNDPFMMVSALKASELSGFKLYEHDEKDCMADTLVIAISQSGTTTDTNRAVDMVRERGAYTLAIVNRRDSDLTFKVDGVMYTSSGRDIEMSVASTKAFYSQIVAGAILALYMARLQQRRHDEFVANEIAELLELPQKMRAVLSVKEKIAASARRLAVTKTYWAAVGSGPNKVAADEIRIKLSELCYKTISSDFIEDKKHIDLSSEPLIIVCAAGSRRSVINDIIKDTAIFKAHKASPVVIADEGEARFAPYADDVFHVPVTGEHLAPILNTLVGHIWGYYAALAINDASKVLYGFREEIQAAVDESAGQGIDVYELILEKAFREKVARFYNDFRQLRSMKRFPSTLGHEAGSDLTLLLKYLSGRLPVTDFELDFGEKGTALNMLNRLFHCLGETINALSRPVDAIKHQAKTVTVGTSRISEKVEGILFEMLSALDFKISQLTTKNVIVLKNIQPIIAGIDGYTLYQVSGLNLLGEPTEETSIRILKKEGDSKEISSRVEKDRSLTGSKRIIVNQGNVYIGRGRKDGRRILIIPILSSAADRSSIIEHLLLLSPSYRRDVPLPVRLKALGGKFEHIKNIVQENSIPWRDAYLDLLDMDDLFGNSAEKIAEQIVALKNA